MARLGEKKPNPFLARIDVPLTPQDRSRLDKQAEDKGLRVTEYARQLILSGMEQGA